jgi:hypothetical protein
MGPEWAPSKGLPGIPALSLSLPDLRFEDLWTVAALAAPFVIAAGALPFITDTWWTLKMGQLSVLAGRPVTEVALAAAPTVPGTANGQWLAQAALYLLYVSLGEVGVRLVAGLALAATFGLVLAAARRAGAGARVAALTVLLATFLAASNVAVRSQLLTYPLFALTYLLLELRHTHPRLLSLLPALFAVWANLHGSFLLGLLLVAICLAAETLGVVATRLRGGVADRAMVGRLALLLAASVVAACLNPLGPGVYTYVAGVIANPAVHDMLEWQPASIHDPTGLALAVSLLLLVATLRASPRRMPPFEMLLLPAFGYLALASMRNVIWWGIVLVPILARHASATPLLTWLARRFAASRERATHGRLNLTLAILIVALALLSPIWRPALATHMRGGRAASAYAPLEATEFLARLPSGGRLYAFQPWTGYLAWRLWPDQQLMLDLRVEAYPPEVSRDYLAAGVGVAEWESILGRYDIDHLVLQPIAQDHLLRLAEASGRWARIHEDDAAVVLARRSGP